MSWEALRLTSRTPSEVYSILGPHGVEELLREMRADCWRQMPAEQRTVALVKKAIDEAFQRNMRVWSAIKKPTPAAFFENLLPNAADGHIRQALVLCYMMLPRGHKSISVVADIVASMYQRMMDTWEEDNQTFIKGPPAKRTRARAAKPPPKRSPKARRPAGRK